MVSKTWKNQYQESSLKSRYISLKSIRPILDNLSSNFNLKCIGESVFGAPIFSLKIGRGKRKILMWSQMHGNESTTTKALFDFLNFLSDKTNGVGQQILESCTLVIIPMLNPDGAKLYTRLNGVKVDLNRDAQNLSQPESQVLKKCYETEAPDFCFNLHGQRTIFSAGVNNKSATLSFLTPSQDEERSITPSRIKSMAVISDIVNGLEEELKGQIGRYDDAFNLNCVGDTLQNLNIPTVLFEAGHFKSDYDRDLTRGFVFDALLYGVLSIANRKDFASGYESYFEIPENGKLFFDIILRNASVEINGNSQKRDVAIQYKEVLVGENVKFLPIIEKIDDLHEFFGHKELDVNGGAVLTHDKKPIYEGYENDFVFINNELFSLKN
ncbi:MAG: peptidase M14 [Bacteroidetes bacterium MedPE-SWsnd-G2]|nr:MAG: peptidase M14 [Bacteroidetes bacterium MedPE-SWsnd-G2]